MPTLNTLALADDAVFIADSHWMQEDRGLLECLDSLHCSQVFLMGDIAQVLVGNITSSRDCNKALLEVVKRLSERSNVYWFEGNHDFGLQALQNLLPFVIFVPRAKQPLFASYCGKIISLAHGDLFLNKKYALYISVLNSSIGLMVIKCLDILSCGLIYRALQKRINIKKIRSFAQDEERRKRFCVDRIEKYSQYCMQKYNIEPDIIIEGHFHIGKEVAHRHIFYICLPSFYIDRRIFKLKFIDLYFSQGS